MTITRILKREKKKKNGIAAHPTNLYTFKM